MSSPPSPPSEPSVPITFSTDTPSPLSPPLARAVAVEHDLYSVFPSTSPPSSFSLTSLPTLPSSLFDLSEGPTCDLLQRSFELFASLDVNCDRHLGLVELNFALNRFAQQINTNEVTLEDAAQIMQSVMKEGRDPPYITFSEFHTIYSALQVLHHLHVSDAAHMKMKQVKTALQRAGVNPTQAQLDRLFVMVDRYKTMEKKGPVSYVEFLKLYSYHPFDATDVFLHSWYHYGRNPIPYNMPVEISPEQDFVAGTMAGVALTLVGHPFDTVKVRMQTQTEAASAALTAPRQFRNGIDCLFQTIKYEGILAVFKGMSSPLMTIPLVNAVVFAAYGKAKDTLHKMQKERGHLNLFEITAAGAFSGFVNCFIICPVELVKTRLQIQYQPAPIKMPTLPPLYRPPGSMLSSMEMARLAAALPSNGSGALASAGATPSPSFFAASGAAAASQATPKLTHIGAYTSATFDGPLDCIRKIVAANGLKGLYRGMSATMYREIPGYSGQFFAYESMKRAFAKEGQKPSDVSGLPIILAGGMAGIFGWMVSYPMDYVKSQIQAEAYDKKTPYRKHPILLDGGFFDCWKKTVKTQGHRALWKGFGVCLARAFPANAAGFFAYEWTLKAMQNYDISHV